MVAATTRERVVGNYALRSLIGRGGQSEVYSAEHRFLGDRVALKLLHAHLAESPGATEAFLAEAARTRAIEHPNVVRVVDFGTDPTTGCYLVMEHIAGESLAARLRRDGRIAEPELRTMFAAIADGITAAHARGIVHRDLKPANVMLDGEVPKLVDFGIAKQLDGMSPRTTSGRTGTPAYMAPEQLASGVVAPCVDVWAYGVMLFEAATGSLPFAGFEGGRAPQLFDEVPRPSSLVPLTAELERVIERCLERDPARRFASFTEIASALRGELERVTQDVPEPRAVAAITVAPAVRAPAKRRFAVWIAAGLGAATLGIVAAAVVADRGGNVATAATPVATVEAPLELPRAPALHELAVTTTPPGAEIVVGGRVVGVTPARISVALPAAVALRRAGHRSQKIVVDRAVPELAVTLVRVRPPVRLPVTKPTAKQKQKPDLATVTVKPEPPETLD
ncbi:MAG: protein kinase [Kofleriaceae bacterium]